MTHQTSCFNRKYLNTGEKPDVEPFLRVSHSHKTLKIVKKSTNSRPNVCVCAFLNSWVVSPGEAEGGKASSVGITLSVAGAWGWHRHSLAFSWQEREECRNEFLCLLAASFCHWPAVCLRLSCHRLWQQWGGVGLKICFREGLPWQQRPLRKLISCVMSIETAEACITAWCFR